MAGQDAPSDLLVIAPNLKRRLSGVTSTVVRLIPIQAQQIGIVTTGPGLPDDLPHMPLWKLAFLPRDRWRVWHARRNTEMALGLILRHLLRRKLRLLFTSAAQRHHTGFTKWLIGRMDRVVATTSKAAGYLERDATVVMHGVDASVFEPATDKAALRADLALDGDPLIGCFGRIRHQKGTDIFVEAMLRILPKYPNAKAIVLGRVLAKEQDFWTDLETKIEAANLGARILRPGEVPWDQVVKTYRALDLYIAPQRWEGFGLTPLESMASGTPVVATPVGAFDEIIVEGETGTIVPIGDVDALVDAIDAYLSDPERLARAADASRAHVSANFAIETEANRLIAIYREMLSQG